MSSPKRSSSATCRTSSASCGRRTTRRRRQASAVVGTHTHIPTADARILPGGTAYVTDVGMVGPRDGCIGMDKDVVIQRFLSGVPNRFVVASGPVTFNSVLVIINPSSGQATSIQRIDREHV